MRPEIPHPIPYQGSKRQIAPAVLSFVPTGRFARLIEPFAGSAAITLAAASQKLFDYYVIADVLRPLIGIWEQILREPEMLSRRYRGLWRSQLASPRKRYDEIRDEFNSDGEPAKLLFLLARCVKNSVRFSSLGEFNQSPDKRRLGTKPDTMEQNILGAHRLLSRRCDAKCMDFRESVQSATSADLVYMDPPYQGTSGGRDRRYIRGIGRNELISVLVDLNRRGVQYILSYDGACGSRTYGEALPSSLGVRRVLIDAGRSSQATLNGENRRTLESLYLSEGLHEGKPVPKLLSHKTWHTDYLFQ